MLPPLPPLGQEVRFELLVGGLEFRPAMTATSTAYEITAKGFEGATVRINQDGRVWLTR